MTRWKCPECGLLWDDALPACQADGTPRPAPTRRPPATGPSTRPFRKGEPNPREWRPPTASPSTGGAGRHLHRGLVLAVVLGALFLLGSTLGRRGITWLRSATPRTVFAPPQREPRPAPRYRVTDGTRELNVRSGPGAGHPVVAVLRPEDEVVFLGPPGADRPGWVRVRTPGGREGYAASHRLAPR